MDRVDVAVVGGGPAGGAAAWAAAAGGADVALFEKGVPRRDRPSPGPDSTDAAGILDYWVDLMALPGGFPEEFVLRPLDRAEFIGPTERVAVRKTGIDSTYPHFGFTYDRVRFDDWLLERAERAGADVRVGVGVETVETAFDRGPRHTLVLRDGSRIETPRVILADGPQRAVSLPVLTQFLPGDRATEALGIRRANHIAYQEYRRFPEELFDPSVIKFWWGHIPGHTAYPWVFPNDDTVARVGLTMPIGIDLGAVDHREAYKLLASEDERIPSGEEYIRRLLALAYPEYDIDDFPLVTDRGKADGTETYPISSTRPIDSPTAAGIAVTGGAMGATSAFHEGGAHVALRTGRIAGELAAAGALDRYNDAWRGAVGEEIRRNVALADLVADNEPSDWDRLFRVADRVLSSGITDGASVIAGARAAGWDGFKLAAGYRWRKHRYRGGRFVQIREADYVIPAH